METQDEAPGAHLRKAHQDGGRLAASFESDADNVKFSVSIPRKWLDWLQRHLTLLVKHWMFNQAVSLL